MGHITLTLLCLATNILVVTPLDPDAVFRATTYINNNFFSGYTGEYAYFVKFTANECNTGLQTATLQRALLGITGTQVQNKLNNGETYYGSRMVAATPIETRDDIEHAEYRLLYSGKKESPVRWLLRHPDDRRGCAVFYSAISPCADKCSHPDEEFNIVTALNFVTNLPDNRAFAFRYVYQYDKENRIQVWASWPALNNKIPLYRCSNSYCIPCVENNLVVDKCYR